jgi:hypothetical protein
MHNGEVLFKSVDESEARFARPEEWFTNARIVIVRGNVIRKYMTVSFLRGPSGQLYIRLSKIPDHSQEILSHGGPDDKLYRSLVKIQNPGQELLSLEDNVYLETSAGACLNGLSQSNVRPGLHEIHNIIRMCRSKNLQDESQKVWSQRKMFLRGLADLHNAMDDGVYEASIKTHELRARDSKAIPPLWINESNVQKFVSKWTARARRTRPIDRKKLEEAIRNLYNHIELEPPRIAYATNPLTFVISASFALALAFVKQNPNLRYATMTSARNQIVNSDLYDMTIRTALLSRSELFDDAVVEAFEAKLDSFQMRQFRAFPNGISGTAMHCAIEDALNAMRSNTGSLLTEPDFTLETRIAREILKCTATAADWSGTDCSGDIASGAAEISLFDQLTKTLAGGSASTVKLLDDSIHSCRWSFVHCNTQEYDEFQVNAFAEIFGERLPNQALHTLVQNVWSECGLIFMHKDFCVVCEYPTVFNVDENGALHGEGEPSIIWKDGWKLYHINGICVSKKLVEDPASISVADIENESNIEIRRLMLDAGANEIQRDECGILYRHVVSDALEAMVMVEVTNSTAEADGTFRKYFLRVPPHITTARAAIAWTFNLNSEEYNPILQT